VKFDKAEQVEAVCYQMRLGDYPRGKNRALINNLFNGLAPYTDEEQEANGAEVNVNFLESTRLAHEARTQYYQAFQKPGNYFTSRTDMGPPHKRNKFGQVRTKEITRVMKRSIPYMECNRSKFALNVLHGIAPSGFRDSDRWRPDAFGVEDVFVPASTLLTMANLPFFAIKKTFTAPELIKLTRGAVADPGWNKALVESCIEWVDQESMSLMSTNWPEIWSPEKVQERIKSDGGFYVSDSAPTISVFDFYFWCDDGKVAGWKRRMILDSWSTPTGQGAAVEFSRRKGKPFEDFRGQFLYQPEDRIFASDLSSIINWQFADLSAVAPFRYHSVRSLGFLLYSVCHLQNRMRCKFVESVFEQMLIYFRVKSMDDVQRVLKVDMINRGFIDDSVDFIKAADRYQINADLVELGLRENANLIAANSSSYTAQPSGQPRANVEKTKFEVMSEVNAMTSLVSASLQQAYFYQVPEYREISRRFCKENSKDPEVRTMQANCLRQGLPTRLLYDPECWDIEPERVLGAGNKTLEMAIVQQLMEFRNLYDPESQRMILRDFTMTMTDDPGRAEALVPETVAKVTDSVHDAQLAAGTLMQGLPVAVKSGMNHIEYVDTLLHTLATIVQQGATNMQRVNGMNMIGQNIAEHIQLIAQDPQEKPRVKQYQDQLAKVMNVVKQLQHQVEQQLEQAGSNAGDEALGETQAKIQGMMMQAKVKSESTATAHAQKTAQRQLQFEMEEKRKSQEFQMNLRQQQIEAAQDIKDKRLEAAHQVEMNKITAEHEARVATLERAHELEHQKKLDEQKLEAAKAQAKAKAKAAAKTKAKSK
jgi:hypothetical protein